MMPDFFDGDFDDADPDLPPGHQECDRCGEAFPDSHFETDTGFCIGCEDELDEEEPE